MICEPRWFNAPVIKPGYGEPEPLKPAQTMDAQENVEACLNCLAPACKPGGSACKIRGIKPAKEKRQQSQETLEMDAMVRKMIWDGWCDSGIRQELGISEGRLKDSKRRLRMRGEIG